MKVFACLLAVSLLAITACHEPASEGRLDIFFIDVGQGSAILLRTPDQRTCLIDGGPTYAGANEICPILDSLRITELDYCIATNYTPERIGGLDEVIRYVGGEEGILFRSFDRGGTSTTSEYAEYWLTAGSRRAHMRLGELIEMGDLSIWCIAANGRVLGEKQHPVSTEQDRSIALLVSYGDFDMLVASDLAGIARGNRLPVASGLADVTDEVEILAVGDYGSANSVTSEMERDLNPVVSVISVGPNEADLPAQRTINRLARRDRAVYQTIRTGSELIPPGKGHFIGGDIHVSVGNGCYVVAGDTFRTFR